MYVNFEVRGAKEVVKQLRWLRGDVRNRILRMALRAGGKVIADEAKENIKEGPAKILKGSVKVLIGKKKSTGLVSGRVRAKAPHAWPVEHGHKGSVAGLKQSNTKSLRANGPEKTGKRALTIRGASGAVVALRASTKDVAGVHYMQKALYRAGRKCVAEMDRVIKEELAKLQPKAAS